jgi:hypothetical protein
VKHFYFLAEELEARQVKEPLKNFPKPSPWGKPGLVEGKGE